MNNTHSTCISNAGYFDSPDFLAFCLHTNTIISTPIHLFGFYCILWKTPESMKSAKWYLLILHIWVVAFDYSISILTIPFVLIPAMAGYPLGVIKYLGLSTLNQVIMGFGCLGSMGVSIAVLFESRFHTICTFPGKRHWTRWRRPWAFSFHAYCWLTFLSFSLFVPDQETAKQNVFKSLPCLPQQVYNGDNFVLTENVTFHLVIFMSFFFTVLLKSIALALGLLWSTIRQLQNRTMSKKTFHLHIQFLMALGAQVSMPLFLFAYPLIYFLVSFLKNHYDQTLTNIGVIMLSMHGFSSLWVMVLVHRPYRVMFYDLFKKSKISSRIPSINPLVYQQNRN